jgi:hypothetical protein
MSYGAAGVALIALKRLNLKAFLVEKDQDERLAFQPIFYFFRW